MSYDEKGKLNRGMRRSSRKGQRVEASGKGQTVKEAAAPQVILRWQDLGDDPEKGMIIVAPEDYMPSPVKPKKNRKEKGKGEKAEGPPLANYIKISEFALACKMCPNPDWHPTFQCPNLTPELKERLKEARLKGGTFRAFHPNDQYCHICLSKDHWSSECKYQIEYPPGADIGPHAEIVCMCCGKVRPHTGEPGVDWKARAVLKTSCMLCNPETVRRIAEGTVVQASS